MQRYRRNTAFQVCYSLFKVISKSSEDEELSAFHKETLASAGVGVDVWNGGEPGDRGDVASTGRMNLLKRLWDSYQQPKKKKSSLDFPGKMLSSQEEMTNQLSMVEGPFD